MVTGEVCCGTCGTNDTKGGHRHLRTTKLERRSSDARGAITRGVPSLSHLQRRATGLVVLKTSREHVRRAVKHPPYRRNMKECKCKACGLAALDRAVVLVRPLALQSAMWKRSGVRSEIGSGGLDRR